MLLKNLTKVWISEYETINEHGEKSKKWKYKGKVLTLAEVDNMTESEISSLILQASSSGGNCTAKLK